MVTVPAGTRRVLSVPATGLLALGLAACGSGDGGSASPTPGYIAKAEDLCGGSAVSKEAGRSLQVITG